MSKNVSIIREVFLLQRPKEADPTLPYATNTLVLSDLATNSAWVATIYKGSRIRSHDYRHALACECEIGLLTEGDCRPQRSQNITPIACIGPLARLILRRCRLLLFTGLLFIPKNRGYCRLSPLHLTATYYYDCVCEVAAKPRPTRNARDTSPTLPDSFHEVSGLYFHTFPRGGREWFVCDHQTKRVSLRLRTFRYQSSPSPVHHGLSLE